MYQKLMTKDLEDKLPKLYSTENVPLADKVIVAKYFHPYSHWTWYAVEYDPKERLFWGLVDGDEKEWGYFSLDEMEKTRVRGLPVERDMYFKPTKAAHVLGSGSGALMSGTDRSERDVDEMLRKDYEARNSDEATRKRMSESLRSRAERGLKDGSLNREQYDRVIHSADVILHGGAKQTDRKPETDKGANIGTGGNVVTLYSRPEFREVSKDIADGTIGKIERFDNGRPVALKISTRPKNVRITPRRKHHARDLGGGIIQTRKGRHIRLT